MVTIIFPGNRLATACLTKWEKDNVVILAAEHTKLISGAVSNYAMKRGITTLQ
jgi:hypothetical protein